MKRNIMFRNLIITLVLIIEILFLVGNVSYAKIPTEEATINMGAAKQLESQGKKVTGVIKVVVIFIAVAGLMVLGIRYMYASVEEKVQLKQAVIMYIIGFALVFSITKIVEVIYQTINKTL